MNNMCCVEKEKLEILKNHISFVCKELVKDYGEYETVDLRTSIITKIDEVLISNSLKDVDSLTFKEILKEETKNILLEKVNNNEFDIFSYKNEIGSKCFLNEMTNEKIDTIKLGLIYILSGYTKEDFSYCESRMEKELKRTGCSNLKVLFNNYFGGIDILLWGNNCKAFEEKGYTKTLVI